MLCHPLKVDPESPVGFRWRDEFEGDAPALPIDEFMISAHIVPSHGAVQLDSGVVLAKTLNRFSGGFSSYAFSQAFADVWRPEIRRLTLVRLQAVVRRAADHGLKLAGDPPIMVIKEVSASHGADLVMSLFPRSRMIFLVRDGRDVLDSMLDARGAEGWMAKGGGGSLESEEERRRFVRESCLKWAGQMTACVAAYDEHDPALRRRIRYEDLLADTAGSLGDLASWMRLPRGPKWIESVAGHHAFDRFPDERKGLGKVRRSATPGGWRRTLSPEDQGVADEIMGPRLLELGYER